MSDFRSFLSISLAGMVLVGLFAPSSAAQDDAEDANWELLFQAEYEEVETPDGWEWNVSFPDSVERLHEQSVRMRGFVIPLGYAEEQEHFLISAFPGHGCFFHMPGGPESIVEVRAAEPVAFTYNTIAVEGRLELLWDDPYGLLYRLTEAKPIEQ